MPNLWRKSNQANPSNLMQLVLSQTHLDELLSHATQTPHLECCGYLLGLAKNQDNLLQSIIPMNNVHPTPCTHFAFSPFDQLKVAQSIRNTDLQIIGIYHSHPSSPPIPSSEDKRFAFFANQSFFIISLQDGITFASYRIKTNELKEEKIKISNFLR